jgi:hypothetical protein
LITASGPIAVLLLASAPALAAEPTSTEPEQHVRNRLYFGTLVGLASIEEEPGERETESDVELILGESLTARLLRRGGWTLELIAAGRMDLRTSEEALQIDDARIRALGLRLRSDVVEVDLGRFSPAGGVWRLVDGVQVRAQAGRGVYLGAWGGLSPDPWTTAPAMRYGGGPILGWRGEGGEFAALGEILATADGIDRVSGVAQGRVEFGTVVEIEALLDLQTRGKDAPVVLSDAMLRARFDPIEPLRIDLVYDAWSSWSYLVSATRDPALTRFEARSRAALDDPWIPQDTYDPTVYHMVGATVSWRPELRRPEGVRLNLDLIGRYRYHEDPLRQHARAGLRANLTGLAGGRVDLSLGQAYLWWSDEPATETTASLWASLDPNARVALDTSAMLIVQPHDGGTGTWGPSIYADLFLDGYLGKGVTMALGYALSNSQDLDRWDVWHGLMGRVGWSFDSARPRIRKEVEP